MNLIDCYIIKVLSEEYKEFKGRKWVVARALFDEEGAIVVQTVTVPVERWEQAKKKGVIAL